MTSIQAQIVGETALLQRADLERLVEVARRSEVIDLQLSEPGDITTFDLMRLAERGGAFEFWNEQGEDIYSVNDGEPLR
jgi:hypothetical protein